MFEVWEIFVSATMMILTKRFCDPPNLSPIGFCGAKVWFLWCKSMVFVVRKYGVSWVYVGILQFVRSVVADRQQHYRNPSAALSQSVRSCRGPIYRAHIYVNTHVMGREMRVR